MPGTKRGAIVPSLSVLLACLLAACSAPPQESAPPEEPAATPPTQAKASVLILSEPAMASVAIDGRDTGKKTPSTIIGLDAGRKLNVEVTLEGYEPYRSDVTLAPGENRLPIALTKLGANLASGMPATPPPTGSVGTIEAASSDPNAKFFIGGDAAFSEAAGRGVGKLNFVIKPWADVYINDQIIGTTPFAAREFPAGTYRVRLVNKDLGAKKTFTVRVEAGQTTKVVQSMAGEE